MPKVTVYRVESGFDPNCTIGEIVLHEREELGNDIQVTLPTAKAGGFWRTLDLTFARRLSRGSTLCDKGASRPNLVAPLAAGF